MLIYIITGVILVMVIMSRHFLYTIYLCMRYGANNLDIYLLTNIRKFNVCKYIVKRNNRIKFMIPHRNTYVEGRVIGLSADNNIYIQESSGDIIQYNVSLITDEDLIYIK